MFPLFLRCEKVVICTAANVIFHTAIFHISAKAQKQIGRAVIFSRQLCTFKSEPYAKGMAEVASFTVYGEKK